MIRIAANQIEKYYGANQVLKGLTLEIFEGEKVGILGPNGAGKSTLMKVLMQEEPYDAGELFITRGARLGALSQIPVFDADMTVRDCLKTAFNELLVIQSQIEAIEKQMAGHHDESLLKKYGELTHQFEHGGGYTIEDRIEDISSGFNFDDDMLEQTFDILSGGEKTRVGLATMLLKPLDVIFLDEPTNHLDLNTIEWLENYIKKFSGTVVIISHDRYFLNQIVTRVLEVNRGIATSYKGNYDDYARERALMIKQAEERYEQEQKKIKQLEDAAKRMHDWAVRADSGALHRRAFAIEKRIDRMEKTEKIIEDKRMVDAFDTTKSTSKEVIRIKALSKAYGNNGILKNQSLTVYKDQRIALLGNNGAGKSTLIKMLLQMESSDSGSIEWSPSAIVGYLPQEIAFDYPEMTVLEFIKDALELEEGIARSLLARFKFKQEDVFKQLSGLSGGERTRLKLCELMSNKVNVLLLDEPTNHLDITSREWVEDAIETYHGTMIFISHDRHFIEKFSDKFWHLHEGHIYEFDGSYTEYRQFAVKSEKLNAKVASVVPTESVSDAKKAIDANKSSDEKKSLDTKKNIVKIGLIESEIEAVENKLLSIEVKLSSSDTQYEMLEALIVEKAQVQAALRDLYDTWEKYNV